MMSQNNVKLSRLATGNVYNLETIFSGENDKIVIPDMQRDYCWGEKGLVANFLDTIIDMDKSQPITMGLLYGYVNPLSPEHIQLCDGQQRLTTLFLLIGMINKRLQGNPYLRLLMSDFELNGDDREPYLQYSIRESSLYFLSDLTSNFFLDERNSYTVEEISNQPWFLNSYHLDPTIRNIIDALHTIDGKLNMERKKLAELGEFVTTKINFLYHDMGDRKNGEETFVVINTTGEPLTTNQNLKPLFIKENEKKIQSVAEKWEQMETWFWQNRDKDKGRNHTADQGMREFFRVVRILALGKDEEKLKEQIDDRDVPFPYKDIDGTTVFNYFEVYRRIYKMDYGERKDRGCRYTEYTNGYLLVLLPVLVYCRRFTETTDTDIKRVYHLFSNMLMYRKEDRKEDRKDVRTWLWKYLQMINAMKTRDVCSLMECETLPEEERRKLTIIASQSEEQREKVEFLFAEAEGNEIFKGQISTLLDWSKDDTVLFEHYLNRVKELWVGECDNNIDTLRRALLSYGFENYPLEDCTLGWEWKEWYDIFDLNKDKIKQFLDDGRPLDEIINAFTDENNLFYPIIKDGKYLNECKFKRVHLNRNINAIVLLKQRRLKVGSCLFFNGKEYSNLEGGWTNFWVGNECDSIFARHKMDLDIHHCLVENMYFTRLYQRECRNIEKLNSITELGLIKHESPETSYQNYWETEPEENWEKAKAKMEVVARWVDDNIK